MATCFGTAAVLRRRHGRCLGRRAAAAVVPRPLGLRRALGARARHRVRCRAPCRAGGSAGSAIVSGGIGLILSGATAGLIGIVAGTAASCYAVSRRAQACRARYRRERASSSGSSRSACSSCAPATSRTSCASCISRERRRRPRTSRRTRTTRCSHTSATASGATIRSRAPAGRRPAIPRSSTRQLPAARKKFPDVAPLAFPTRDARVGRSERVCPGRRGPRLDRPRPLAGTVRAGARAGSPRERAARSRGGLHDLSAMGIWGGQGLVAGIPLDARHLARPSAWRRRRLRRGVRRLLRENGRNESSGHRRGRVHRLESRRRARSSAATTSACSTTSRPATARISQGSRSRSSRESSAPTSVSTPRCAASRSCTTSARSDPCRARCRIRSPRAQSTSRARSTCCWPRATKACGA